MTGEPYVAHADPPITAAKQRLRDGLLSRRATLTLPDGDRTDRALALCGHSEVVALYASLPGEPDTWDLIDRLVAGGTRVLLPVLRREPDWAWYTGRDDLAPAWRGILQPTGPRLGGGVLVRAEWIWVPGLAGSRGGDRIGTGGGWYDRALLKASPTARIGMLLYDGEVLDRVPTEPWDRRVRFLLTASQTVRAE